MNGGAGVPPGHLFQLIRHIETSHNWQGLAVAILVYLIRRQACGAVVGLHLYLELSHLRVHALALHAEAVLRLKGYGRARRFACRREPDVVRALVVVSPKDEAGQAIKLPRPKAERDVGRIPHRPADAAERSLGLAANITADCRCVGPEHPRKTRRRIFIYVRIEQVGL